jgi:hypothetical protein
MVQAGILLAGDWLIRPANRRALAFVTASSWIVLGGGVLILGCRAIYDSVTAAKGGGIGWILGYGLLVAAAACYWQAAHRWRKLTRPRRHEGTKTDA